MFKVKFSDPEKTCLFAELKSDVEACQVALALHQASNVDHLVQVFNDDNLIVSLVK